MNEDNDSLSQTGLRRKVEILRLAQRTARQRRGRRLAIRIASTGLSVILLIVVLPLVHQDRTTITLTPIKLPTPSTTIATIQRPRVEIIQITTNPMIARENAATVSHKRWTEVNDDELLRSLGDAGTPAGLAEINGRVELLFR